MALRFPVVNVEGNEIIHPDDWNNNLGEFVNEINGNLDSDNFDESVPEAAFKAGAFTEVFYSRYGDSAADFVSISPGSVAWHDRDEGGDLMPSITFDAETDGLIVVEANARVSWSGNGIPDGDSRIGSTRVWSSAGVTASTGYDTLYDDYLKIRTPVAWGTTDTGFYNWDGGTGDGDLPSGGWVGAIRHEGPNAWDTYYPDSGSLRKGDFPAGRWIDKPIDFYGVRFRLVVNGEAVSESGWLHNGNYKNATFLCGAVPVTAGRNKVTLEVRGASLHDLKPHPRGVGSKHRMEPGGVVSYVSGKFVSKVRSTSIAAESPLPGRSTDYHELISNVDKMTWKKGITAAIAARNMTITFRKR
tara:strand:+ start:2749 stop:3822 length:1074 start_codon:yes stop_codon:yes gene_type:complete